MSSVLNWISWTPRTKFLGTPLVQWTDFWRNTGKCPLTRCLFSSVILCHTQIFDSDWVVFTKNFINEVVRFMVVMAVDYPIPGGPCMNINGLLFSGNTNNVPFILKSNPHTFYSFRGLKHQKWIRIACGLDPRSWAGFWKNGRAAVCAIRAIKYNDLLFYLLFIILYNILYNIYNLLFIRLAVITHNWISLPCRQRTVEVKLRIRTAN